MALLSFPFLNRLAQDLSNHARPPPNLAEQTWTCFGQWQLLPWARVEVAERGVKWAGGREMGEAFSTAEKATGASSV